MRLLYLLFMAALFVAAILVYFPLLMIWESGDRGPPSALLVVAAALAMIGFYILPGPEPWPSDKSQLQQISGKVLKAKSVHQGSSSWYELELDGPRKYLTVGKWSDRPSDDDIRGVIGREITAGCYERPEYACQTVSFESGGRTLVSYDDVLSEWRATNDLWRTSSHVLFGGAGLLAAFSLGWLAVRSRG